MNNKSLFSTPNIIALAAVIIAIGLIALFIKRPAETSSANRPPHGSAEEEIVVKGPHGGRLLGNSAFQVEVTIYETGIPPEFRVYPYLNQTPEDLNSVNLTITLRRFGGVVDVIKFQPRSDYLLGDMEVVEPHSFSVEVSAVHNGQMYSWQYDSFEGRTEISRESAAESGIKLDTVKPATIQLTLPVVGSIRVNAEQLAHVSARYAGVIRSTSKQIGDSVEEGDVLAVVESNNSLQPFNVATPLQGTILEKHVTSGTFIREGEEMFSIANLNSVWVDFTIPRQDFSRLKLGQMVTISGGPGLGEASGSISYLSPTGQSATQSLIARVVIPNAEGMWRPGINVKGEIVVDTVDAPVAVKNTALQTFRDWDVVFLNDGTLYEIAILELGRRDSQWIEVLSGIDAGQSYVAENSFLIKADVLKSGASHDH